MSTALDASHYQAAQGNSDFL